MFDYFLYHLTQLSLVWGQFLLVILLTVIVLIYLKSTRLGYYISNQGHLGQDRVVINTGAHSVQYGKLQILGYNSWKSFSMLPRVDGYWSNLQGPILPILSQWYVCCPKPVVLPSQLIIFRLCCYYWLVTFFCLLCRSWYAFSFF